MKLSGLSVDVDSVASHLEGYGFERGADDGAAYRIAIPRALQIFESFGARATFFLIAEEAAAHPARVREIVARGHEVASHSMTHELPFSNLTPARAEREIDDSRRMLAALAGEDIIGFRAPSWDTDPALLTRLAVAGYRYDASAYPSILLPLLRRSIAARAETGDVRTGSALWNGVFGPTTPYTVQTDDGEIWEIPLATTPFARLPHYHTMRFVLPKAAFGFIAAWTRTRRAPITYQFHAADFLATTEDGLDPRISRHPGMELSLGRKLRLAEECTRSLARVRRVVPLRDVVEALEQTRRGGEADRRQSRQT